jgi:hypothetical protein
MPGERAREEFKLEPGEQLPEKAITLVLVVGRGEPTLVEGGERHKGARLCLQVRVVQLV